MRYPVTLEIEKNGVLVGCPDIPEMHSVGDTVEDALREALDGLESAIELYFDNRRPIPAPSLPQPGQQTITLPALIAAKVLLHNEMLAQDIKKAELARRLNIAPPNVERIFRVRHKTRIETVEAAIESLGRHIEVSVIA
jgi:antitoxin HicB